MRRAARDERFMRLALAEADAAAQRGDVPVGAVVVVEGRVAGWSGNVRAATHDPAGHAELLAIREAARRVGDWRLAKSTLYVTLEPCVMCAGVIGQARVERVVFGCRDTKAGAVRSLWALVDDPRQTHRAAVAEGVLADACRQRLATFFEQLRRGQHR